MSLADKVVTNNKRSMRYLSKFVEARKLIYIPNNGAVKFVNEVAIKPDKIVLGVGRLHPQKAFDVAIDAFAQSSLPQKDWRLVIIGEGDQRARLEEQARNLNLENHILLPGFKPDIASCYVNAACLLVTSKYEGTPNVVLEALFLGLPVIVSGQAGDAPILIDKLGLGTTVESGASQDFALALDRFVQNGCGQLTSPSSAKSFLIRNLMTIRFLQSGAAFFSFQNIGVEGMSGNWSPGLDLKVAVNPNGLGFCLCPKQT